MAGPPQTSKGADYSQVKNGESTRLTMLRHRKPANGQPSRRGVPGASGVGKLRRITLKLAADSHPVKRTPDEDRRKPEENRRQHVAQEGALIG
jgi:hypothetical protein